MNKKHVLATSAILMLMPLSFSLAVILPPVPNLILGISVKYIIDLIFDLLWPISITIVIIAFIIIGFLFLSAQGDPEKIAKARLALIGAVIVTALLVLAWSIPFIVQNTIENGI